MFGAQPGIYVSQFLGRMERRETREKEKEFKAKYRALPVQNKRKTDRTERTIPEVFGLKRMHRIYHLQHVFGIATTVTHENARIPLEESKICARGSRAYNA
jgi:hypothetical protein